MMLFLMVEFLHNVMGFLLMMGFMASTTTAQAEDSLIPANMVYIGYVPSVMGLDKEAPATSGNASAAYQQRNRTPASTFNDEGPAHMLFLDPYLIDKYEVSNQDHSLMQGKEWADWRVLGVPEVTCRFPNVANANYAK